MSQKKNTHVVSMVMRAASGPTLTPDDFLSWNHMCTVWTEAVA